MYRKLSKEERYTIDKLFNQEHLSIRKIAAITKRSPSTISRELKRNTFDGYYDCEEAHKASVRRSWHNHSMYLLKYSKYTKKFLSIYDKRVCGVKNSCHLLGLNSGYRKVSYKQVYNWINSNRWAVKKSDRLRRYYVKGGKRKVGIFSKFKDKRVMPIWVRPKHIDLREEFGHWELDLIIGKKANGFDNIITFTERKTRMLFITRIKSKNSMKVNAALWKLIKDNNLHVKTITTDNGIEFEKIGILANWANCLVYYCEPFASYQKGSNENINGLVRRFYKKGTSFNDVTDQELLSVQNQINLMEREMFNWTSSYEMYQEEIKKWTTEASDSSL